jgi:hypothetical protein
MTQETPELAVRELRRLRWRLQRRDPLRRVADALIARDYAQIDGPPLIAALESRSLHWARRLIAAEALRFIEMDPGQARRIEEVLVRIALRRDMGRASRYGRRALNLLARFALTWTIAFGLGRLVFASNGVDGPPAVHLTLTATALATGLWLLFGMLMFFMPVLSPILDLMREQRLRHVALQTLGRVGGAASVDALAASASLKSGWATAEKALPPLRRVLKRLDSSDYGAAPPEGIRRLCELLMDCDARGLTYLAADVPLILEALGRVGGGNAVETVERIAEAGRMPVWRAKARDILPVLRERQRREQDSARLLRATESPRDSESLLRPAAASSQPAELLLRAGPDDSTT